VDKARSEGKPLYVAFVDLKNAFPSTDLPTLWVKLYQAGLAGPLFDWLRMLYARMSYMVRSNGTLSSAFKSFLGLLTGDTASPILWNLYFADIGDYIPSHCDDIVLQRPMSHLEQADNVVLFSTSLNGLQSKVDGFFRWCKVNFMVLSVAKTKWMILGPIPRNLGLLTVDERPLELVDNYKYVGLHISSTNRNMFHLHYIDKAGKARSVAQTTFTLDESIGHLPPAEARLMYLARVDPHLTFGCEVMLDVRPDDLEKLVDVQVSYLRRLLSLSSFSQRTPLYTETGILPIGHRRITLTLGYLQYLISLPPGHDAHAAFLTALDLAEEGSASWFTDLQQRLATTTRKPAISFSHSSLLQDRAQHLVESWKTAVIEHCESDLQQRIEESRRLPLLQLRSPSLKPLAFRHYLKIKAPHHRQALTRMLLGEHPLAVEMLRRTGRYDVPVPAPLRLCRFCREKVETEIHALTECEAQGELIDARREALESCPSLPTICGIIDVVVVLHSDDTDNLAAVGKLCYVVLRVYESAPIYIVDPSMYS